MTASAGSPYLPTQIPTHLSESLLGKAGGHIVPTPQRVEQRVNLDGGANLGWDLICYVHVSALTTRRDNRVGHE
jgi:hypothetical protein